MKKGWEEKTINDILSVLRNGVNCKQDKKSIGDKISRIESIANADFDINKVGYATLSKSDKEKHRLIKGDILFSHINSPPHVGKTALFNSDEEVYHGVNLLLMRTKPLLKSRYFEHYLKFLFQSGYWRGLCKQSVNQASVNQQDIKKIKVTFPSSVPEQQHIVAILDKAFAAIDKAKANAEQNLKNAKALFESYLQDLFTRLFQVSDKKIISEIAKVIGGYSFKSSDFKEEGKYQVLRMGNVRPGIIRVNEHPVFIDEAEEKVIQKSLLLLGDVIITQTGTKKKRDYGFTAIIEKDSYLLNQRIAAIRFSNKYLPKFFLYFSWTDIFKNQYFANETGTVGQGNVGIGAITSAEVPFISVNEQQLIIDRIDEWRLETQKLEAIYQAKINNLEELKKSILQKAFTGELTEHEVHT
jgi:type I restriction enzyme S subunit